MVAILSETNRQLNSFMLIITLLISIPVTHALNVFSVSVQDSSPDLLLTTSITQVVDSYDYNLYS